MSLLEVRNLRVRFDTPRGAVQAIDTLSLSIDAGETLALVGESGSGKSATALALAGLLPRPPAVIETGEVVFDGRDLLQLDERAMTDVRGREIGFVFQDPTSSLHPLLTIGEQLGEVLEVHEQLGRRAVRERCAAALAEVGIADAVRRLDAYPHELSGGMRQRAMIAMALLCRPKLLIADEPTTALDVTIQAQVLELLRELQRRHGTAILLISHDLGVVARNAERVAVMYAGAIVESASVRELFARPAHPYTSALLRSLPSLSAPLDRPLATLGGAPPDPTHPLHGCAFEPRCAFAVAHCSSARPPLLPAPSASPTGAKLQLTRRRVACFEAERVVAEVRR